ncbi:threonine dehydratase [Pseudomonas sp. NFIX28]|nr:threonine dehydratase [Pseudomonas sp. NFIX28]
MNHPAEPDTQLELLEHYVKKILAAPVYDLAVRTPLQPAPALSAALGNQVLLKREDLQPTFSFKIRGAYNKLVQLSDEQKRRGVITASAGNHAQGVALAARELGIKATIVMPSTTPQLKVQGVSGRGAQAVLHGESFPFALAHALRLAESGGQTFVSPFDDPDVIAGQGTVGMEILRQHGGRLDVIFVPVGGGGLIAGIAAYVKYLRPEVRIVGVESEHSNCLQQALQAGERVVLPSVGTFADGGAGRNPGGHRFRGQYQFRSPGAGSGARGLGGRRAGMRGESIATAATPHVAAGGACERAQSARQTDDTESLTHHVAWLGGYCVRSAAQADRSLWQRLQSWRG